MLYWSLLFLVVAIICGIFGFGGPHHADKSPLEFANQVLFFVFLVAFIVMLFISWRSGSLQ